MGKVGSYRRRLKPYARAGIRSLAGAAGRLALRRLSGRKLRVGIKRRYTARGRGSTVRRPHKRMAVYPADNDHSGKTLTKHSIFMRKGRRQNKQDFGHFTYHQQNSELIIVNNGLQAIVSIGSDLTTQQLQRPGAAFLDPAPNSYYYGLMSFNPNKRNSGDGAALIAASTQSETTKLWVKNIFYDIQFANMTTVPVDIIIYCVTPKTTVSWNVAYNQLTDGALQDAREMLSNYLPTTLYAVNPTDASGVAGPGIFGKPQLETVGFSPFELEGFRKMYKPLFKKELNVAAGAFHKFEIMVHINKLFNEEIIETMRVRDALGTGLAHTSLNWFVVVKGSPVIIRDTPSGPSILPNNNVTTSPCEVAWTMTRKITGHYCSGSATAKTNYAATTYRFVSGTSVLKEIDAEDTVIDVAIV